MSSAAASVETDAAKPNQVAWWLAVGVLALCVIVYFQTWRELWPVWMDTDRTSYTHGLLIAAVSLWLVWRSRQSLAAVAIRPVPWLIPIVLTLSLAWLVLAKAGILTLHAALWPVLASSALFAACGWRVASALAFPLAYLWFAVPVWDHLGRLLQTLTVLAVDGLNNLTHVPGMVVGDIVIIPQGRFEIAAGCSGLHFFVVALAIGALAGEIHRDRFRMRVLLMVIAAVLALVTNWLRVYFIILAGYLTDMQHYLVTVDHYKFGWVLFAVSMVVFFLVLNRLPVHKEEPAQALSQSVTSGGQRGYLAGVAALILLPVASAAANWLHRDEPVGLEARAVEGFTGPLSPSPAWGPVYVGPDSEIRAAYLSADGRVIDHYANVYYTQSQGRELIGYENHLLDPAIFRQASRRQVMRETVVGTIPFVEVVAEHRNGRRWAVMYHYRVGGRRLAGDLETQLAAGFLSLWSAVPAGIHAVAAPCDGDCGAVEDELAGLLASLSKEEP